MNSKCYLCGVTVLVFCLSLSSCQFESEKAWHERKCQELSQKIGLNYQPVTVYGRLACSSKDSVNDGSIVITGNTIFLDKP